MVKAGAIKDQATITNKTRINHIQTPNTNSGERTIDIHEALNDEENNNIIPRPQKGMSNRYAPLLISQFPRTLRVYIYTRAESGANRCS